MHAETDVDSVLNIIFVKMMGEQYMAGVDAEHAAVAADHAAEHILIVKGMLTQYAAAVGEGDVDTMRRISKALSTTDISKAFERHHFTTGDRDVQVYRDKNGQFSSFLTDATSTRTPVAAEKGKRRKGQNAATKELAGQINNQLQGKDEAGNTSANPDAERQSGQQLAGRVRAISRMQDELIELFGDTEDVVVIVEDVPTTGSNTQPERRQLKLNDPVSMDSPGAPGVLATGKQGPMKMGFALKDSASPRVKQDFATFNGLLETGIRPDTAADITQGRSTSAGKVADAFMDYGGLKRNTNKEKAKRHFNTADKLGDFFVRSNTPAISQAGAALKATAAIGSQVPDTAYDMAERANYRYRGMKDTLPKPMSDALKAGEHRAILASFNDPNLTRKSWKKRLDDIDDYLSDQQTRNPDVFWASPHKGVLASELATIPEGVSPRNFVDRYTRDLGVMSLIPRIPADTRAVRLGESAGFGVPSTGIVIRADGQSKESYHGVGPDHYLPFSAKALPELRDGQYVRTRTRGGLTNEDVTTLVASGGRKATVVSGSGVFSLELRPDTSAAGRLRSPEVAAMGERYERILDRVAESGIYMKDLAPEDKERIKAQAAQFVGSASGTEFNERVKALEKGARDKKSHLTEEELATITNSVRDQVMSGSQGGVGNQQRAAIADEMVKDAIEDARKEKVRMVSLNAEGYALALQTLALQYPSIIKRTEHSTLKEFVKDRGLDRALPDSATLALRNRPGGTDTGYVTPGTTKAHTKQWSQNTRDANPTAERVRNAVDNAANASVDPDAPTPPATPAAPGAPAPPTAPGAAPAAAPTATPATGAAGAPPGAPSGPAANLADYISRLPEDRQAKIEAAKVEGARGAQSSYLSANTAVADWMSLYRANPAEVMAAANANHVPGVDNEVVFGADVNQDAARLVFLEAKEQRRAVESIDGLTVALALAFDPAALNRNSEWDVNGSSTLTNKEATERRVKLDDLLSTHLLDTAEVLNAPTKTNDTTVGFYVPPEIIRRLPAGPGRVDADETLEAINNTFNDTATPEGQARMSAANLLDEMVVPGNALSGIGGADAVGHGDAGSLNDVSVLGLIGLQVKINEALDQARRTSHPELIGAITGDPSVFNDDASFNAAREQARTAYQAAIGRSYLTKVFGESGAGPKGRSLVAKSRQPVLEMLEAYLLAQ